MLELEDIFGSPKSAFRISAFFKHRKISSSSILFDFPFFIRQEYLKVHHFMAEEFDLK